jgi:hypothetical protein
MCYFELFNGLNTVFVKLSGSGQSTVGSGQSTADSRHLRGDWEIE